MRKNICLLFILITIFVLPGYSLASENEEESVKKALDAFYSSLNAMFTGDAEALKEVWSHSEDVVYMGATGKYQIGWGNMYKEWQEQAKLKFGGSVKYTDLHVIVGKDIAVTNQLVKSADPTATGVNKDVSLRASSVFRKENGKWKMIGHHADVIPELEK